MQARFLSLLLIMFFALPSEAKINRFEELFIWKMSEALELDAKKEADFAATIKKLNKQKASRLNDLNALNTEMAKVKDRAKASALLIEYQTKLTSYQSVNLDEVKFLQEIFNPMQMAKYLSYKSIVLSKLQAKLKARAQAGAQSK